MRGRREVRGSDGCRVPGGIVEDGVLEPVGGAEGPAVVVGLHRAGRFGARLHAGVDEAAVGVEEGREDATDRLRLGRGETGSAVCGV